MVRRRRAGKVRLGCLLVLVAAFAVGYFSWNIGKVWLRFYRFQDAMVQEARFAARNADTIIRERLRAKADSLGLPEGARRIRIRRTRHTVFIWSEYTETVELPLFVRDFEFYPHAERAF
jgi:hypothetical protein